MKRFALVPSLFLVVCAGFPAAISGDSEMWEVIEDGDLRRLERGQVIIFDVPEGNGADREIQAAFFVNRPIDPCWELLRQPERQGEFTATLEECFLVKESLGTKVVHFRARVLFLTMQYQVNHLFDDEHYRADTSLNPGFDNDLTLFDGIWRLYPVSAGTTLVRYGSILRINSFIPTWIQRYLIRKSIPSAMEAWKLWLQSGGTWRRE